MPVTRILLVLVLLIVAVVPVVHAEDKEKAMVAFSKGKMLFDNEQYQEAAAAFEEAMGYSPTYKLLYNVAQCHAASRQYGLALETFESYLARGGDDILTRRLDETIKEMERLKALVGSIAIENAPEGGEIFVDDTKRGDLPLLSDLRVTAGIYHEIVITKDNQELLRQKVKVGSGGVAKLKVETQLPKEPVKEAKEDGDLDAGASVAIVEEKSADATPAPAGKGLVIGAITTASLAVVAAGLGVGFWAAAGSKTDDFNAINNDIGNGNYTSYDLKERTTLVNDIKRLDGLMIGMYVGAGVMAATSLVLTIVYMKKKKTNESVVLTPTGIEVRF